MIKKIYVSLAFIFTLFAIMFFVSWIINFNLENSIICIYMGLFFMLAAFLIFIKIIIMTKNITL